MRWFAVLTLAVLCLRAPAADDKPAPITFLKGDEGKLPAGWSAEKTGRGEGSVWKVVADDTAPSKSGYALEQSAAGPRPLFNLCVAGKSEFRDGEIRVRFKSVSGEIDQGGGVVWRYKDANNYYVARYNPLEKNYRVYKVEGGVRTQLGGQNNLDLPGAKWYTLSIRQSGDRIECFLDGKPYLDVKDDTFKDAGKVGLWTKADAVTRFDELVVTPKK